MRVKLFVTLAFITAVVFAAAWSIHSQVKAESAVKDDDEETAYLGVYISAVSDSVMEKEGLASKDGARIAAVQPGSPADEAGLMRGDIVIAFDDAPIKTPDELSEAVKARKPEDKVKITFIRAGERQSLTVTLGKREERSERLARAYRYRPLDYKIDRNIVMSVIPRRGALGIKYQELTDQLGEYFGVPSGKGVLVTSVDKDSAAEKAGVKAGDVIVRFGDKEIEDGGDLQHAVRGSKSEEPVSLALIRDKREMTVSVTMEKQELREGLILRSLPEVYLDRMEDNLRELHVHLEGLDEKLAPLEHIEIDIPQIEIPEIAIELPKALHSKHFFLRIDGEGKVNFNGKEFNSIQEFKDYLESEEFQKEYKEDVEEIKLREKEIKEQHRIITA